MGLKCWWHSKALTAKVITVLSALLLLQVGLCFSTQWTVQPVFEAIPHHPDLSGEYGPRFALVTWQALLSLLTLALLIIMVIIYAVSSFRHGDR